MKKLPFGVFNGNRRHTLAVRGFSLAEIVDPKEKTFGRHSHSHAHFCFVLRGGYITGARGAEGTCGPATMLFHPAGTTHYDRFHPESRGGSFLTLSIETETMALVGGHGGLIDHEVGFTAGELPFLGARLYRELRARDEVSPLVVEGLALELLALTARESDRAGRNPQAWLGGARDLIQDCFRSRLTVQQLARTLDVDPLHLSRCFRRRFGCSPGDFLPVPGAPRGGAAGDPARQPGRSGAGQRFRRPGPAHQNLQAPHRHDAGPVPQADRFLTKTLETTRPSPRRTGRFVSGR